MPSTESVSVMVWASVKAAMNVTAQLPKGVFAKTEPPVNKAAATPRLGAHIDLTGSWAFSDWIGNYMTGGGRRRGLRRV